MFKLSIEHACKHCTSQWGLYELQSELPIHSIYTARSLLSPYAK